MNTSLKGEYALSALFDLATQPANAPIKIAEIARRQKIPQKFLELILASLKQGGFVESRRGAEGGYMLSRPPGTISVGNVLRFVEGARGTRKRRQDSPYAELWDRVDRAVADVIDTTTLENLATSWRERQSRYIPNWDI